MPALPSPACISRYYLVTWLGVIAHVSRFTSHEQYADPFTALWTLAVTASYSMFYLLPSIAGGYLCYWLLGRSKSPRSGNLLLATTLVAQEALFLGGRHQRAVDVERCGRVMRDCAGQSEDGQCH